MKGIRLGKESDKERNQMMKGIRLGEESDQEREESRLYHDSGGSVTTNTGIQWCAFRGEESKTDGFMERSKVCSSSEKEQKSGRERGRKREEREREREVWPLPQNRQTIQYHSFWWSTTQTILSPLLILYSPLFRYFTSLSPTLTRLVPSLPFSSLLIFLFC